MKFDCDMTKNSRGNYLFSFRWEIGNFLKFRKGFWSLNTPKRLFSPILYGILVMVVRKKTNLCPENLTFPKAEREQQCPRLIVVIFCLFISI